MARMQNLISEKKTSIIIFVILLVFIITNILFVYNTPPGWDESVYVGMGKYIFSLGEVGGWEIMRPIALPVMLGFLWKLGLNIFYATKSFAVIFAAMNIFMVFIIGRKLFGDIVGLSSALILAVTPVFFEHSTFGLTEIPSTFFALLTIYFLIRKVNHFFLGMAAALAFMFRFPQGVVFFAVALILAWSKRKDKKDLLKTLAIYSSGFLAIVAPFLVFNYFMYHNDVSGIVATFRPLLFAIKQQTNPFYAESFLFYPTELFKTNPLLLLSIPGVIIFLSRKSLRSSKALLLLLLLLLAYFTYIPSKVLRFSLVFLPYLAIFSGVTIGKMADYKTIRYIALFFFVAFISIHSIPNLFYNSQVYNSQVLIPLEFYAFYKDSAPSKEVLITTPYPLLYSDIKAIPVYYPPKIPFKDIKSRVSVVMLDESVFLCPKEDYECITNRDNFLEDVKAMELVFSENSGEKAFKIYRFN